jgi:thiazole synthase
LIRIVWEEPAISGSRGAAIGARILGSSDIPGSSGNRAERLAPRAGDPWNLIRITPAKGVVQIRSKSTEASGSAASPNDQPSDELVIAGRSFSSRLIVGTGKFGSYSVMRRAIEASGTEIVTVALRRIDLDATGGPDILEFIDRERVLILPNTSGAVDAEEAVRLARLARAAGLPAWVKLEVTPEPRYLLPDPVETLKAAELLVADGFTVLPYINADPVLARRLEDAGCATVMPLGSWIGSNKGVRTRDAVQIILEQANVPVVIDAGLGAPSHAADAMEIGADAVLVNTAIAVATDPVEMARAFRMGVEAGRRAWRAGIGPAREVAEASSPLTGFLQKLHTSQADPAVTSP